ncbi:MAG: hypothetical protein J1F63_08005 [Oscillospiraceae bacterium]|nr:hypothetical protein [Oscillospiraceae bacterium]
MKAIKRPLIYFLIWVLWTFICISLSRNEDGYAVVFLYATIGFALFLISHYHIRLSSNREIMEKEPELYEEIRSKIKENFVIPPMIASHDFSAAMMAIYYGKVREYPSIRPQVIEYKVSMAARLLAFLIFAAVALCIW